MVVVAWAADWKAVAEVSADRQVGQLVVPLEEAVMEAAEVTELAKAVADSAVSEARRRAHGCRRQSHRSSC
jgi:hypothetical protein